VPSKQFVVLDGQATHVGSNTDKGVEISIISAMDAVNKFDLQHETALLHINCEGCEYSFL